MSRIVVMVLIVALIIGALFLLSRLPSERPTHTIEVAVSQSGAGGNAH